MKTTIIKIRPILPKLDWHNPWPFPVSQGKTIKSSTSKIKKTIHVKKKWTEKGLRCQTMASKPHSNGLFLLLSGVSLRLISSLIKSMTPVIAPEIKVIVKNFKIGQVSLSFTRAVFQKLFSQTNRFFFSVREMY